MTPRPISACRYPWNSLYVEVDGAVKPCCFARAPLGSLARQNLEEIWNGALFRQVRAAIRGGLLHPVCRGASCRYARQTEESFGPETCVLPIELGKSVTYGDSGDGWVHVLDGWSVPEPKGVWTLGRQARMAFEISPASARALKMIARVYGFCCQGHPETEVDVEVNGLRLARWSFQVGREGGWRTLRIPAKVLPLRPRLELTLHILNPGCPKALGESDDARELGVALQTLLFERARPSLGEIARAVTRIPP